MMITMHAHWRPLACLLALACASTSTPCSAQTKAAEPDAAVPETRYQPAHIGRAPALATTTPDRAWQENNRIVAGQPGHTGHAAKNEHAGHAAHAGHANHASHAQAAQPAAQGADPHAHHRGHQAPPDAKEHH